MKASPRASGISYPGSRPVNYGKSSGFTIIELMIVMVIVAIGVALASPTFRTIIEKRELTATMEEVSSFLSFARGEAVKRNEEVTVSWSTPGGHNVNWCIGAIVGGTACDCTETVTTEADFCAIDGLSTRMVQADFVDINFEFMHMNPNTGNFSFDPVRGVLANISSAEIVDNDYLFYVHSDEGSGTSRDYKLELWLNITGRIAICGDATRQSIISGYAECGSML